ncbi:MAG: isoprenylcysteine carboxylmethyltransferase family protein [Nanoarchaeota archaeon]|nr:isoprenylcysteine carboxylmethyltransferase family protein [Nanoarchaeota archaeon]
MLEAFQGLNALELISTISVLACTFLILISIFINFALAQDRKDTVKEKRSIVATGSMLGFFIVYYLAVKASIGYVHLQESIRWIMTPIGVIILIIGTVTNILGRFALGRNWADHIRIYKTHAVVKTGVYRVIRHPLYASLIWMFYAGALIYSNLAAFILNTAIFLPFMHYRAKQEEEELSKRFKDYKEYSEEVGMFFPRVKI